MIGFKDTMRVTPSHLLTKEQAAQVKSVTTKSGSLKFEVHDKMAALVRLARILGMTIQPAAQTMTNTQVNVGQVNVQTKSSDSFTDLRQCPEQVFDRGDKIGLRRRRGTTLPAGCGIWVRRRGELAHGRRQGDAERRRAPSSRRGGARAQEETLAVLFDLGLGQQVEVGDHHHTLRHDTPL